MAFKVRAVGLAGRRRYIIGPKGFGEPGKLIGEGLTAAAAIKAVAKLLKGQVKISVMWFVSESGEIWLHHVTKGGTFTPDKNQTRKVYFRSDMGVEEAMSEFVSSLKKCGLHRVGFINALTRVASQYESHCATYGKHRNGVMLRLWFED